MNLFVPQQYRAAGGLRLYTLNVPAFPHLRANAFLVVGGQPAAPSYTALVDVGGSHEGSTEALLAQLEAVRDTYHEQWSWKTLSRIVITHPHPDHVAGLPFVRTLTNAPIAAHALALPTIQDPQARIAAGQSRTEAFVRWAGITGEYAQRMRRRAEKLMLPAGVSVQTALQDGDLLDGVFRVIYTPGHEGSQICLQLHDILLSADHLLPRNSPPLMPERLQDGAGLRHFLQSLDKIERLEGVNLAIGGHDQPMPEWRARVHTLRERFFGRLQAAKAALVTPQTVSELMHTLNPQLRPVQAVLLLDQTAALAEYLLHTGQITETLDSAGRAQLGRIAI